MVFDEKRDSSGSFGKFFTQPVWFNSPWWTPHISLIRSLNALHYLNAVDLGTQNRVRRQWQNDLKKHQFTDTWTCRLARHLRILNDLQDWNTSAFFYLGSIHMLVAPLELEHFQGPFQVGNSYAWVIPHDLSRGSIIINLSMNKMYAHTSYLTWCCFLHTKQPLLEIVIWLHSWLW